MALPRGTFTGLLEEELRKEDKESTVNAAIADNLAEENQWLERFNKKNQADVIKAVLSKRISQGGTPAVSAERKALLSRLQSQLPENSSLSTKFALASDANLKQIDSALNSAKAFMESNNRIFTVEDAENVFENFTVEVIDKGNDFDPVDMLKTLGFDQVAIDAMQVDFEGGLNTESAVSFNIKTNVDGTTLQDQKTLTGLYRDELSNVVANSLEEMTTAKLNGQEMDQGRFNLLKQAESALKASTPSTAKAARAVGAEVAVRIMELNPTLRPVASYINKGLVFQQSDEGMALLKRAVKSGLLDVGDSYEVSGLGTKKMTASLKDKLMG